MGGFFMDSILYTRIKELCEENRITTSQLESVLGFGNSSIKKWKATSSPSVDKVVKIAAYFDVSVDYLLGRSEISKPVSELLKDEDIISLQRARQKMSMKDREKMMKMLKIGFDYAFDDNQEDSKGDSFDSL